MWPEENLGCGLKYEEEWGELPDEIAAMAFALPSDVEATDKLKRADASIAYRKLYNSGVPHEEALKRAGYQTVGTRLVLKWDA
jgi:hypothetical protein